MYQSISDYLKQKFYGNEEIQALLLENEKKVLNHEISSFVAAKHVLDYFRKHK